MYIDKINNSYICYEYGENDMVCAYREYCVQLLKKFLAKSTTPINLILGRQNYNFQNNNKTLRTDLQVEHTLVKLGGRSVDEVIFGNIPHNDGKYLIRISDFSYYNSLDFVIEYSLPNIFNISSNSIFDNYLKKVIHISSTVFETINLDNKNKTDIITTFIDDSNLRRNKIINELNAQNININRVKNAYTKEKLTETYNTAKILINVHQTDHHHTFEELRVLPALMKGVVVISEDVPLKEKIPYSEYIVWADYNNITETVKTVINNYNHFYENLFVKQNFIDTIEIMKRNNDVAVKSLHVKI